MAVPRRLALHFAAFAGLLVSACAANANQESSMTDGPVSCSFEDDARSGVNPDEVCEIFTATFAEAGREDIARIALKAISDTEARAAVLDREGKVLVELDYTIMDREMRLDTWRNFARSLLRELTR